VWGRWQSRSPGIPRFFAPKDERVTFLVDIGDQEPSLGHDPELAESEKVLIGVG